MMKWYFSEFTGYKNMENIMKSFGALLIIRARPVGYNKGNNNSLEVYNEFCDKVKQLSHVAPFKSIGYEGCLWDKNKTSNCSKYSFKQ